jgi:hypothetical protein
MKATGRRSESQGRLAILTICHAEGCPLHQQEAVRMLSAHLHEQAPHRAGSAQVFERAQSSDSAIESAHTF